MPKRLSKIHRRRWLVYCHVLKRRYPLPRPVRIITCRLKDDGDAIFDGKRYRIRINNANSFGYRRSTLSHEYAHCLATLSWHEPNECDPIAHHDEIFAVWNTRCERLLAETYEQLPDELKDKADRTNPEG
jgi:hypothetical protein